MHPFEVQFHEFQPIYTSLIAVSTKIKSFSLPLQVLLRSLLVSPQPHYYTKQKQKLSICIDQVFFVRVSYKWNYTGCDLASFVQHNFFKILFTLSRVPVVCYILLLSILLHGYTQLIHSLVEGPVKLFLVLGYYK